MLTLDLLRKKSLLVILSVTIYNIFIFTMTFSFVSLILIILYTFCINGTSGWLKLGCVYNGKYYSKGDTIGKTYNAETDTCIEYICKSNLRIVSETTQNCHGSSKPTTSMETSSTPAPTPPPTTAPQAGCYYNGQFYPPDTEISSGQQGNWCYFTFCDTDGQVISGDDWNCGPSTTTTPPWTTGPTTAEKRSMRILEQEIKALLKKRQKPKGQ